MKRILASCLLGLVTSFGARAQYFGHSALQQNFESTDFFFQPTWLNPYGLEGFGPAAPGVLNHMLLDLQLSPSLAQADSGRSFAYVDFRSVRERTQDNYYAPYYDRAVAETASLSSFVDEAAVSDARLDYYPGPGYGYQSYQAPEPVLAAALFGRPTASLPRLTAGITYRLITSDQNYYDVPSGLYRGLELAADAATRGVPITDVYSGSDQMHTTGHFTSLFGSWALAPSWRLGLRADFTSFNRDGEFGNTYNPSTGNRTSTSSQFDGRTQEYSHTDLSVGFDGFVDPTTHVGGSIGVLMGTGTQIQDGASLYRNFAGTLDPTQGQDGHRYVAGSLNQAQLERSGQTTHAAAFMRRNLSRDRVATLSWQGRWQDIDLDGWSDLADSSMSQSQYNRPEFQNTYFYDNERMDVRSGDGTGTGNSQRFAAGMDWTLSESSHLTVGVVGMRSTQSTTTREDVLLSWSHDWEYTRVDREVLYRESRSQSLSEDKVLNWEFESRRASLQIPVILRQTINDHFEVVVGVTRRMEDLMVKDEIIAEINSRLHHLDGEETSESNLRERFRQPTIHRSNVTTSGILGLVARPTQDVEIRLTVSPQRSSYYQTNRTQWWFGFQFRP